MITRIRLNNEVVGYKRIEGNYTLFSKDLYGWNGTEIQYNQEEKSTDFKDKNAQLIFENDVLEIKDKKEANGFLYYVSYKENEVILNPYNTEEKVRNEVLMNRDFSIKKIGYLEDLKH